MPASTVAAISQERRGDANRRSVFSSLPSWRRAASRPTPYRTNGRHTFVGTPTGDSSLSGILQQKGPLGLLAGTAKWGDDFRAESGARRRTPLTTPTVSLDSESSVRR